MPAGRSERPLLKMSEKMDWDKAGISTLREVLDWVTRENRAAKRTKRELSHTLANGFLYTLEPWVRLLEEPSGNANYFCVEIDGITLGITPFDSHEEMVGEP